MKLFIIICLIYLVVASAFVIPGERFFINWQCIFTACSNHTVLPIQVQACISRGLDFFTCLKAIPALAPCFIQFPRLMKDEIICSQMSFLGCMWTRVEISKPQLQWCKKSAYNTNFQFYFSKKGNLKWFVLLAQLWSVYQLRSV